MRPRDLDAIRAAIETELTNRRVEAHGGVPTARPSAKESVSLLGKRTGV